MAIPTCRSFAILGLGVEQVTEPCGTVVFVGVFEKMFMFVVFGSFEIAVIILVYSFSDLCILSFETLVFRF